MKSGKSIPVQLEISELDREAQVTTYDNTVFLKRIAYFVGTFGFVPRVLGPSEKSERRTLSEHGLAACTAVLTEKAWRFRLRTFMDPCPAFRHRLLLAAA